MRREAHINLLGFLAEQSSIFPSPAESCGAKLKAAGFGVIPDGLVVSEDTGSNDRVSVMDEEWNYSKNDNFEHPEGLVKDSREN